MIGTGDAEQLALLVHEVRSPVAAIAATAASSDEIRDEKTLRELVRLAVNACRGIERLVFDTAPTSLRPEDVELGGLVRDAAATAKLDGANIRAEVGTGGVEPVTTPTVRADPFRLRQALDNLVANAVAYSPPGTEVVVRAYAEPETAYVAVTNAGRGIADEDQARIFDPGVRLNTERPGSGLGLHVARAIVEAHGGSLTVRSTPGEGTTFTIALLRNT